MEFGNQRRRLASRDRHFLSLFRRDTLEVLDKNELIGRSGVHYMLKRLQEWLTLAPGD
jgi:hypothetical protein